MKVKLKRGWSKTYATLTVGNVYRVLGIEAEDLRIVDDTGDPILFCPKAFELVDAARPASWISERGDDGELYAYPPELRNPRCFFDAFHEEDTQVRRKFSAYMNNLCHAERAADPDPPNSYVCVAWTRESPGAPIARYIELDEARCEVRKVELFRDGRITYAWGKGSTGTTQLDDPSAPPSVDIGTNLVLEATGISGADFEAVWNQALESDDPGV